MSKFIEIEVKNEGLIILNTDEIGSIYKQPYPNCENKAVIQCKRPVVINRNYKSDTLYITISYEQLKAMLVPV